MVWLIFLRQHSRGPGGREEPSNNLIRDRRTCTVMEESASLTCQITLLSCYSSASPPPHPVTVCIRVYVCVFEALWASWEYTAQPCFPRTCMCASILHCIKGRCNVSGELSDVQCACKVTVWGELEMCDGTKCWLWCCVVKRWAGLGGFFVR